MNKDGLLCRPCFVYIMDKYTLPTSVMFGDIECGINADFRNVLKIFEILHDPDLLDQEKLLVALNYFYDDDVYKTDLKLAATKMFDFLSCCDKKDNANKPEEKPLYDWEHDFNIIIAPVNRVLGYDVRGVKFLHWWTFMSAFMEIGECTLNTYIQIRKKLQKNIKLEKYEEKLYKEHRNEILLPKKYDKATQELMDMIMGKEG